MSKKQRKPRKPVTMGDWARDAINHLESAITMMKPQPGLPTQLIGASHQLKYAKESLEKSEELLRQAAMRKKP
jgi:hypothetical protein